jgi:hypothetical protein
MLALTLHSIAYEGFTALAERKRVIDHPAKSRPR